MLLLVVVLLAPFSSAFALHHDGLKPPRRAEELRTQVRFAEFETTVTVQADGFEQYGWFTLGAESDGVDPLTQDLRLSVGTFAVTIPAGAFRRVPPTPDGRDRFTYEGTIGGTWLEVALSQIDDQSFELKVEGRGEPAMDIVRPEFVTLAIGDNVGSLISVEVDREA